MVDGFVHAPGPFPGVPRNAVALDVLGRSANMLGRSKVLIVIFFFDSSTTATGQ